MSPYFPPRPEPTPYQCEGCNGWFLSNGSGVTMSCLVYHPPGTCCHYNETAVEAPKRGVFARIMDRIDNFAMHAKGPSL